MKTSTRRLFSLSVNDSEYCKDNQDKIELVKCFRNDMKCKEPLFVINQNYHESDRYLRDKDFQRSIEKLKKAYYITFELKDKSCLKCATLFRSTITESLINIKDELREMTTGFFGNKHYQTSYIMVNNVLQELEKVDLCSTVERNKSKEHYMEPYLKKSVS